MSPTRLDLDRYVPALLTFVSNKLARGASATYRRHFGIGVTEWRIISLLALEPGIPAQRICNVIGFDKALVSRSVQILQQRGDVLVQSDRTDNRRRTITLTASGLNLHDRVIKVALERERLLLADMTAAELTTLLKLLHHMHRRVDIANAYQPELPKPAKPARRKPRVRQAAE